ncbi:MAG: hypothetical protein ACRENK_15775 [Gemmatimonadaceae bacterium]
MSAHAPHDPALDLASLVHEQAQTLNRVAAQAHGAPKARAVPCPFCIAGYTGGGVLDSSGVEHGLQLCRDCNGTTTMWIPAK